MRKIYAPKLKTGDEARVIAPAKSLSTIDKDVLKMAVGRLESLGLKVTFGRHVNEADSFRSSSIRSRLADLHNAFRDSNVRIVLPVIGGFNSNQLLSSLDYNLIKRNPKIIGGYSDITALQNAIYAKTGLVTYSSPAFATFGMKRGFDYSLDLFKRCFFFDEDYEIRSSENWSNDSWYLDQESRKFRPNIGMYSINRGSARGTLIGGNLCTLNLLQGTKFMPSLGGAVLFIEDDSESKSVNFDRDLQSLIHQPDFNKVRGIVIGRFEDDSEISRAQLIRIIKSKEELRRIPVIADANFGHTDPIATFPVGGEVEIEAKTRPKIIIRKH